MFHKIIHAFIRPRHPWRTMKFDELAEIYTSMSLRSLGFGIIGIFVPVYLYGEGVGVPGVFWFFSWVFLFRIPLSIVGAFVVGRIGPKHGIALSTLLFVLFLGLLLSYSYIQWPLLALAFMFTLSNGLFFLSYHTDFSKIKDSKHGGRELGWLYTFERIGGTLGPLLGGAVAAIFTPEAAIVLAILVLTSSLVPLFLTNEPVKLHQKITYRNFPWRRHIRDYVSLSGSHLDNASTLFVWPLFISVVVFSDGVYVKLGAIIAFATAISLFSAQLFGKVIDTRRRGALLRAGVICNSLVHISRPFAMSGSSVVLISTINEPVTLSYRMPLMKGYYDAADSEPGYRIVYVSLMECFGAVTKALYFLSLWATATYWFSATDVLRWNFIIIAVLTLTILFQKFPALKKA